MSCNDQQAWQGVPSSNIHSEDVIFGTGQRAYTQQYSAYAEAMRIEGLARSYRARHGHIECANLPVNDPSLVALGGEYIIRERLSRESSGGAGCRCIPMGESCINGTCFCNEICPNHHGILRGRANQMAPTAANGLVFTNSDSYNGSVYHTYPMSGGFCTGHNIVTKKLQMLSDFRPNLQSRPALTKGTPGWRQYMKAQLKRFKNKINSEFVGVTGFGEICRDPELFQYLKSDMGFSFGGDEEFAKTDDYWNLPRNRELFGLNSGRLEFISPTLTNIPAKIVKDPDTDSPLPSEGTVEYQRLLEEKTRNIMHGLPQTLPGVPDIKTLSSNPALAEIMGEQIALDWRAFNTLEESPSGDAQGSFLYVKGDDEMNPMTATQMSVIRTQSAAQLPRFPAETYPRGASPGESWNENGPFQTMTMSIRMPEFNSKGGVSNHGRHSVEAWAQHRLPNGNMRICVRDPNNDQPSATDDSCNNYIELPPEGSSSEPTYSGIMAGRRLGKFNFNSHNPGLIGSSTTRIVAHCRKVNRDRFRGGAACTD